MDQVKMSKMIKDNKEILRQQTAKYHKMKGAESGIKILCRQYLELTGWFVFPILQGLGCYPGIADFIAIRFDRVLFIETKSLGGGQRPAQLIFQANIVSHGGEYWLIDCFEDIIKMIGDPINV